MLGNDLLPSLNFLNVNTYKIQEAIFNSIYPMENNVKNKM